MSSTVLPRVRQGGGGGRSTCELVASIQAESGIHVAGEGEGGSWGGLKGVGKGLNTEYDHNINHVRAHGLMRPYQIIVVL